MKANRLRFRAWHPDNERMYLANDDELVFCIGEDGPYTEEYGIVDKQGPNGEHIQTEEWKEYPCIIMQSTGLTDSEGVEIFEGDLLNIELFTARKEVCWHEEYAAFYMRCTQTDQMISFQQKLKHTVVGNIHEQEDVT